METVLNQRAIDKIATDDLFRVEYNIEDVLEHPADQRVRRVNLDKAVTLGRSLNHKTTLVISTTKGFKQFDAVVHFVNDKGVTLEHDHFIPIHSIYSVDII